MVVVNSKKNLLLGLLSLFAALLWGGDDRKTPIDVYIIVDSSAAMEKGKIEAVQWLCGVIDNVVKEGDRLTIWTAGAGPEVLYTGTVTAGGKDGIKSQIRGISFAGDTADYRGALREAQGRLNSRPDRRMAYTLLVSGSSPRDPPTREAESAGLLLYSRVESFSGWRVLTVGLDIASQVRDSAAAYMTNR